MIRTEIKDLDQKLVIEKLDNGLTICLIPFENRSNYYIEYLTRYGADINKFVVDNKTIKVPYGVAHFLEHKVFEQETGIDPFSFFSKTGTDSNAYTDYERTSYLIEGTRNIYDNLNYLIDFVNTPYFTDKNVEKEKGIIVEEVKMYSDDPLTKLENEVNKSVFKYSPRRVDIGGTVESVKNITKEDLYNCYNTFYNPNNMCLFIGGKFDIEKILEIVKNNKILNNRKPIDKIVIKDRKEPIEINKKFKSLKINGLVIPKIVYTFKIDIKDYNMQERKKIKVYFDLLQDILFSSSSKFKENLLKEELITLFDSSAYFVNDLLIFDIIAETKYPEKLLNRIIEEIKNKKITKEEFERNKKSFLSEEIYASDSVIPMVKRMIHNYMNYQDFDFEVIEILKNATIKDVENVLNLLDFNNTSTIIGYPKK